MPPKPAADVPFRPPIAKKNIKGKAQGYELDSAPCSAGEGIFIHPETKAKYEGQWQRFEGVMKRHGTGIYTDGGGTYDGHFVEDLYSGQGTYTAIDGSVYKGEWKSGMMHGHGVYTWPDSAVFDGNWENGKMEGPGVFTGPNKQVWTGIWHEGSADCQNLPVS
jgi:hypothetical protein